MSRFEFSKFSDAVNAQRQSVSFKAGETIFDVGQLADAIYFCVSGGVRMEVFPETEKPIVLYRAHANEAFAEDHLTRDRFTYRAVADAPSIVEFAPKQLILDDIKADPLLALKFINCLAERHCQLRVGFERLGIKSAKARVFHLMMTLTLEEGVPLDLNGRIKGLSRDLNLSHEAVYRALKELEDENAIQRSDGTITSIHCHSI